MQTKLGYEFYVEYDTLTFKTVIFKNICVILVSGQGRSYYCHGAEGHNWQLAWLGQEEPSHPIITIQGCLCWVSQSREPPTPVSRFIHRPLIGQEGTRAASDWSPLMVYCVVVPIRWAQDTDIRFAVHIRADFNILTLSNTSPSQIDCHPSILGVLSVLYSSHCLTLTISIVWSSSGRRLAWLLKWQTNSINFSIFLLSFSWYKCQWGRSVEYEQLTSHRPLSSILARVLHNEWPLSVASLESRGLPAQPWIPSAIRCLRHLFVHRINIAQSFMWSRMVILIFWYLLLIVVWQPSRSLCDNFEVYQWINPTQDVSYLSFWLVNISCKEFSLVKHRHVV